MNKNRICILGLGYIGLPTAGMFAVNGVPVLGVDTKKEIVEEIRKGGVHIMEPGLRTVISAAVSSGNLTVSTEAAPAEVFVIAVPTPLTEEKRADLSYLFDAASMVMPHLKKGDMVIVESTIPPGTIQEGLIPLLEQGGLKVNADFDIVHCPERVIPGKILFELVENDRIIGGSSPEAAARAEKLYRTFVRGSIFLTDLVTAEMVKLIENSYRDVNIAFANELSLTCRHLGVDPWEAITLANRHPRVKILEPGPGVGGHCIAVDPWFIVEKAPQQSKLIQAARSINDSMPHVIVERISASVPAGAAITLLGLTYKADVDDIRESPSITIAALLKERGFAVRAVDPYVTGYNGISVMTLEEGLKESSLILVLVAHSGFRSLKPQQAAALMTDRRVMDIKRIFDRALWEAEGFSFLE
jgi:UDP-N-acetyl-D-mannosaminuronic acid dehydrogenase